MVSIKVTKSFFDKKPVIDAIGKTKAAALAKMGAFVRRSAKSSIRRRKRASEPGKPPSSHVGLLRDFIFFSFEKSSAGAVVGPYKLDRSGTSPDQGTVPGALERGGTVIVTGRKGKKRTFKVGARPYMLPALQKNVDRFPGLFKE